MSLKIIWRPGKNDESSIRPNYHDEMGASVGRYELIMDMPIIRYT